MKKCLFVLLSAALLLMMAAGCSNTTPDSGPKGQDPAGSSVPAEPDKPAEGQTSSDYPSKTIEVVLPTTAGGDTDLAARFLLPMVEKELGGTIIISNVTGGASAVALEQVKGSKADGYTLCLSSVNHAIVKPAGYADINYEDFESVCSIYTESCHVIIRGDETRFTTLEELAEYGRQHPGELTIGTGAAGGIWHIGAMKTFEEMGVDCMIIGSEGGIAGVGLNLLNGDIDAAVISIGPNQTYLESGEMKMLATCAYERLTNFPDVPTLNELGYSIQIASMRGILAPKGTPEEIIDKLEAAFEACVTSEAWAEYCSANNAEPIFLNSEDYLDYMVEEYALYSELVKAAGLG